VRTVVDRLRANFPGRSRGAEITIESDLPLAAGMSSSSALVVGLALAFGELCRMGDDPAYQQVVTDRERLAEYLGCVENGQSYGPLAGHRGVGTFGGSEDHVAMLCGHEGQAVQYSFCPVAFERAVPFPEDRALVIAVSGVQAEKTGSALEHYNRVSLSARDIVGIWNERTGRHETTLGDIVATDPGAADDLRAMIDPGTYLSGRLSQFLEESERIIPAATAALASGDLAAFGDLVDESQQLAEEGLGNQTPETVALQRLAREMGADAASAFGAGFGGSVWAMVPAERADRFAVDWVDRYADTFPVAGRAATWLVTRPGPPAHRVRST
jgi:galactokinase